MKKQILILFSLLIALSSFAQSQNAQNWLCVYPDRTVYFETAHKEVFTIRIDSVSDDGKILYPFSILHQIDWDCYSITSGSWISRYIILDDDGNTFFVNGNNERVFIKSQAALNETWEVFENDQIRVRGRISATVEREVLGEKDSVKTISFSVYNLNDVPINNHRLNQHSIEVSKHFGLVRTVNFYYFEHTTDSWITFNWLEQFTLIGIKELQLGFQVPKLREEYFDFQPGDELHVWFLHSSFYWRSGTERKTIFRYLTRTDFADRIEYTKERKIYSRIWTSTSDDVSITTDTVRQIIQKGYLFTTEPNEPFEEWGITKVIVRNTTPLEMFLWNHPELDWVEFTSCFSPVATTPSGFCGRSDIWLLGLGGPYHGHCCYADTNGNAHRNELVFYRKNGVEFGTPLQFPTSVETVETVDFAIFPNPANDRIFIKSDNNELSHNSIIEIYDISGRKHLSQPLDISESIDVSFLQSGYYIVKIIRENKVLVRAKMIKQ